LARTVASSITVKAKKPTLKQVQAVRCPTCGARPGEKCELTTGLPRTEPHRDRRLIAEDDWYRADGFVRLDFESGFQGIRVHVKQLRRDYLTCRICKKPLRLGTDTTTDENGKSVHEECQVRRIIGTQRYKEFSAGDNRSQSQPGVVTKALIH
jgi:hypothetical protein